MRKLFLAIAAAAVALPVLPAPVMAQGANAKLWRDSQGRYRCTRPDGTVGVPVRSGGRPLIERPIDTGTGRATGTILGAAAGALLGRRIERDRVRCR